MRERTGLESRLGSLNRFENELLDAITLVELAEAGKHPALGLAHVGLHPDQGVDQVRRFPAPGAVPFDDQQRAAGRDLERAFPAVLRSGSAPQAMSSVWMTTDPGTSSRIRSASVVLPLPGAP